MEEQAATLRPGEIAVLLVENADFRQVEGCKRQRFGQQSARRLREPDPQHLSLSGRLTTPSPAADQPPPRTETVKAYQRRGRWADPNLPEERVLRVDPSVPVQALVLTNPVVADLPPAADEVIGEQVTYRLAQRPGAYVILQSIRPVIKRKATEAHSCPPAPRQSLRRALRM